MEWVANAGVLTSLIVSLVTIGGYIFRIVTYLKKNESNLQQQVKLSSPQTNEVSIHGVEWIGIFGQGFIDVVDFIIYRFSLQEVFSETIGFIRYEVGCMVLIGGGVLALAIGGILFIFGVQDFGVAFRAGAQITCILVFLLFSLLYVYVVGKNIEKIQSEYYQSHINQQVATEETSI